MFEYDKVQVTEELRARIGDSPPTAQTMKSQILEYFARGSEAHHYRRD